MKENLRRLADQYARRPGGAFDKTSVPETECLKCGKTYSKPIRWHDERGYKCPECGGDLDKRPLDILLRHLVAEMKRVMGGSQGLS